ncbi:MAG: hypothetical protein IJU40_01430 [Desulfovibrionaceae bacterium]|nr:hypothetical protein [Desulfovibrionaceae bacterium]
MLKPSNMVKSLVCRALILGSLGLFLIGCEGSSSAKDAMNACATALDQNDAQAFVNSFDLKACASNQIKSMTQANDALNTLDLLGRNLGIGGMEDLLGNVFDMENSLRQNFVKKSSTGELANECARQNTTGCPWVPQSLRQAQIKEAGLIAVARVKTPANLTTWIALAKKDKKWLIVGWAPLEDEAKNFAQEYQGQKTTPKSNDKPHTKPNPKKEAPGDII